MAPGYVQLVPVQERSDTPLLKEDGAAAPQANSDGCLRLSTVQFVASIFFADQAEGKMLIDIVRSDATDSRVAAKYHTEDASAKAGDTYVAVSGEVVFEPGETSKTIVVPLVHSGIWSATVEFGLVLSDPDNCNLDMYLYSCRVKVIDDNAFPSDKYRKELVSGESRAVPGTYLFWEYFKWNVRSAKLLPTILLVLAMDQLKNAHMILLLYCDMYLVNVVVNPEAPKDKLLLPSRSQTGCLVAAAHVVPPVIIYLCNLLKVRLDLEGYSTLHLQKSIYRKSMNLAKELPGEGLVVRINTDCPKLAGGFHAAMDLLQVCINVGMHFYFIVVKNPSAIPFAFGLPAAMLAWGFLRAFCMPFVSILKEVAALVHYLDETHYKLELVRACWLRPQMNEGFLKFAGDLEKKTIKQNMQANNTNSMLHFFAPAFIGLFIAARVPDVLSNDLPVGTFLATIAVMKSVSELTSTAYFKAIGIFQSFPALWNLADVLNMETELPSLKVANRWRRATTAKLAEANGAGHHLDELPCQCDDVSFSFGEGVELFTGIHTRVAQGKIVEVRGAHHSGKSTFMRLLGMQIMPTGGKVFMPAHLRTLFVQRESLFFDWSLTRNLTVAHPHFSLNDIPRLKSILRDLKLERLIPVIDAEMESNEHESTKDTWSKALTKTDLRLLSIARAFFVNPDVLVMPGLFASLSLEYAKDLKDAIKEHRKNRGLHMPAKSVSSRRPRTVFYSATDEHTAGFADVVWSMEKTGELNGSGNPIWTVRTESATSSD